MSQDSETMQKSSSNQPQPHRLPRLMRSFMASASKPGVLAVGTVAKAMNQVTMLRRSSTDRLSEGSTAGSLEELDAVAHQELIEARWAAATSTITLTDLAALAAAAGTGNGTNTTATSTPPTMENVSSTSSMSQSQSAPGAGVLSEEDGAAGAGLGMGLGMGSSSGSGLGMGSSSTSLPAMGTSSVSTPPTIEEEDDVGTPIEKRGKRFLRRLKDHYKIDEEALAVGPHSAVYEGLCKTTKKKVAVKRMHKKEMKPIHLMHLQREVDIHSSLDHPNIIKMLDVFETDDIVDIVLEFAEGGDLFDIVQSLAPFTEEQAAELAVHILSAVAYLHRHNIMHRDIKLENVLMLKRYDPKSVLPPERKLTVRLADFGLSVRTDSRQTVWRAGSTPYLAPEVLNGADFGRKADMWAVGATLYMTLMNKMLYSRNIAELLERCSSGSFDVDRFAPTLSMECKHFLKSLLTVEPELRPTAYQAMQHPWLQRYAQKLWQPAREQVELMNSFEPLKLQPRCKLTIPRTLALPDVDVVKVKAEIMSKRISSRVSKKVERGMNTMRRMAPPILKVAPRELSRAEEFAARGRKLLKRQRAEEYESRPYLKLVRQGSYTAGPEWEMPDFAAFRKDEESKEILPHEADFDFHKALEPKVTCGSFFMNMYRRWRFDCAVGCHTGIQNLLYGRPDRRAEHLRRCEEIRRYEAQREVEEMFTRFI